jgi:hypothetical protein
MIKIKILTASVLVTVLSGTQSAQAHCDSIDGPVAKAALAALETGNVNLALPYAPSTAENEIKAAFSESMKVRVLGPGAKQLADRAFIETTVRLHRAGEGAAYTGLKPAGIDYGPAIPAAEAAIATGDLRQVKTLLVEEVDHQLAARLDHVLETQTGAKEPQTIAEIPAARERASAELAFVTYVEGLRQAVAGAGHEHEE